jgi:hypothetical protein
MLLFLLVSKIFLPYLGTHHLGVRGGLVIEALRYKPEDRGIDSRWCHWNFSFA